jgi:hypothetical protein
MFVTALLLAEVVACRGGRASTHDSTSAQRKAVANAAAPSLPTPLASMPVAVLDACAEVAASWRRTPMIALHQVSDTVLLPEVDIENSDVHACHVVAQDSLAFAKSDSVRLERDGPAKSAYWRMFARAGWVPLHWSADGPDGSLMTFQRGVVRCQLQEQWDGGDDSDSTYVPSPFYRQTTSCWSHPAGIAKSDTAP